MKRIKVGFCDGISDSDMVFLPILRRHFEVELSNTPDYLFYGPFGREHLKYDCIKIFTTGECVVPNFNECDYATGFDFLDFGDRYLRLPLCSIMYRDGVSMMEAALRRGTELPPVTEKKFCSFVVSNGNGMPERKEMFERLNEYRPVSSGGCYLNNVGGPVEDKLLFDHGHKFAIAFENECYPGYTTEKLIEAFAAGCVPIYYGDPRVTEYFNPAAFINCRDFPDFDAAVAFVRELDQDEERYAAMLAQPICRKPPAGLDELEHFLVHIFEQELSEARRIPRSPLSRALERAKETGKLCRIFQKSYDAAGQFRSRFRCGCRKLRKEEK